MFQLSGTIANKSKTLKNLLNVIYSTLLNNSMSSSIVSPITYNDDVESCINSIEDDIKNLLPDDKKYLSRWISLKLLDENDSINSALKTNLNIDIKNNNIIQDKLLEIKSDLKEKRFRIIFTS